MSEHQLTTRIFLFDNQQINTSHKYVKRCLVSARMWGSATITGELNQFLWISGGTKCIFSVGFWPKHLRNKWTHTNITAWVPAIEKAHTKKKNLWLPCSPFFFRSILQLWESDMFERHSLIWRKKVPPRFLGGGIYKEGQQGGWQTWDKCEQPSV